MVVKYYKKSINNYITLKILLHAHSIQNESRMNYDFLTILRIKQIIIVYIIFSVCLSICLSLFFSFSLVKYLILNNFININF